MLKVLRVLLLLRVECPGEAVIDDSLLQGKLSVVSGVEKISQNFFIWPTLWCF